MSGKNLIKSFEWKILSLGNSSNLRSMRWWLWAVFLEKESKCKHELEKFSELKSFHSKILIKLVLKTLVFLLYDLGSDTFLFECYK